MDLDDIFKQLTHGVNFKGKNLRKKLKPDTVSNKVDLKIKEELNDSVEIKEEVDVYDDYSNLSCESNFFNDIEIKQEIKSDEESESEMKLLEDSNFQLKNKKTKPVKEKNEIKIKEDMINRIRNIHHIHVNGKHPPKPISTVDEITETCKISSKLTENIKICGYTTLTPIQMQTIPIMVSGRPLLACAPTGSGKTAAFLIPIIKDLKGPQKKGFRSLILCPTRELAKQTQRECLRLTEGMDFRVHIISKVNQAEMKYGKTSSKKYDILITTPKRVCYLLEQDPPLLNLSNVEWLILDEADKLFEETTNSFRDQFDQIFNACTSNKKKVALFSATYTHPVARWGKQNLKGLLTVTIGQKNSATDLIDQELLFVGSESGKLMAFRDIVRRGLQPPVLVFVQSKDRAQQLFNELLYDGINVDVIHADRTQQQRDNVVRAFREGKIWILICTELMSRGIDFKGVNLVINYDFPPTTISYIHRIGRTGRAGRRGKAITFFTQDDTQNLRGIASIMKNSGCIVPDYMLAMKKITRREKRKMEKSVPTREPIVTQPDLKRKKMIAIKKQLNENKKDKLNKTIKRKNNFKKKISNKKSK